MYQPPDLPSLIPLLHDAHFYRVLKSIYKTDKQYARLLRTCFEDDSNQDAVFECIGDCLRPSTGLDEGQINDVRLVIIEYAPRLTSADPSRAASTIDQYAKDLHKVMLQSLEDDESAQLQYLRTLLEPEAGEVDTSFQSTARKSFIEQYVRLLCDYDPQHVSDYIEHLNSGDLRLEEVLPALEGSGAVDAAIVLLARDGKVHDGIDRLIRHLKTLEAALIGLIEGAQAAPDAAHTAEATEDLTGRIQKYVRVGVWLCRGQTKSMQQSNAHHKQLKRSNAVKEELSPNEILWLELIDAVVTVAKNVSEVLPSDQDGSEITSSPEAANETSSATFDPSKIITQLRTVVQETFTALLATTSAPRMQDVRRTDASFLRILRAFLGRASMSSSSLSNLRSVLSAIFSAYAYEESLLALANRLLDKDLFAHLSEADSLRRRGWRPLGQVCEGCGRRVWGPGTGAYVWDAWQRQNEMRSAHQNEAREAAEHGRDAEMTVAGKGKASVAGHSTEIGPMPWLEAPRRAGRMPRAMARMGKKIWGRW